MGTTRGKLGNMVLYRAGGQERQRAYLSRIANPQTDAQTYARIRFRSAGVGYKAFKNASERLSISSKGSTVYNAFISKNRGIAPFHYKEFVEYCSQNGYSLPAPWQVANGPLVTPNWLQGVRHEDDSDFQLSVRIPTSFVTASGVSGNLTAKQFLSLVWSYLGITSDIHLCSSVGICYSDATLGFEKPSYMKSNFHNLMEIWPDSDDLVSVNVASVTNGEISTLGTEILGGVALAGDSVTVGAATYAPVTFRVTTASDVNTIVLHFQDYPDNVSSLVRVGTFGALWIANGSTKQTSTASYDIDIEITEDYNELLTDAWIASVIPSWRASGSSTNDGVYQG